MVAGGGAGFVPNGQSLVQENLTHFPLQFKLNCAQGVWSTKVNCEHDEGNNSMESIIIVNRDFVIDFFIQSWDLMDESIF